MYACARLVMIVMALTLAACQMGDIDADLSQDPLAEGSPPAQPGEQADTAPVEDGTPAPATACDAGTWTGSYNVSNQSDLDALAGYTEVTGSIIIITDDIVHIPGLDCLVSVGGDLRIVDNRKLETVTGFENLRAVGGALAIGGNRYLGSIGGFGELRSAGRLAFEENGRLLGPLVFVVDGFDKLRTVHGNLSFANNHFQIFGFDELELVEGSLVGSQGGGPEGKTIEIHGMRDLSTVGGILFEGMGSVVLDGLVDLERVDGDVKIRDSGPVDTTALRDLSRINGDLIVDGFESAGTSILDFPDLEHIDGHFIVEDVGSLELGSFSDLEFIGGDLRLHEAGILQIVGFEELEVIGGDLHLVDLPLQRLEGFNDLQRVDGSVRLKDLGSALTEIAAFDELESIDGDLELIDNALVSLSAFDDLRSVGGSLTIDSNDALLSLNLPDLETLGGTSLVIRRNDLLSTCAAEDLVDWLQASGFAGAVTINGNGPCQ